MRVILRIYYFVLIIVSFITSLYAYQNNTHYGYEWAFVLPFLYAILATLLSWSNTKKLVIHLIYLVYFIRFVILIFMTIYSGWYTGRAFSPPQDSSYQLAILLMGLEFIIINIFYIIFLRKKDFNLYKSDLKIKLKKPERDSVYIIFIGLSICLLPFISEQVSFLGVGVDERVSSMTQFQTIAFFSLYVSKYLLIGLIIKYFYEKYLISKNALYILSSVLIVLLINTIFIGSNRMDFVLPFVASFILLNYLYKKRMIIYNIISSIILVISLYLISLIRNTFEYQIVSDTSSLITDYIQIYFAGIYNVALSLELDTFSNQNVIITFLYDLIRPFLGLNLLWRSDNLETTSELFNQRIFGGNQISQILPLIGQFYNAFGILGVLVSISIFSLIVYITLKNIRNSYLITSLISIVLLLRIIISPVQNIGIFLNEFSSIILIFLTLNIISYLLKKSLRK